MLKTVRQRQTQCERQCTVTRPLVCLNKNKPSPRWLFNKLNQEFPHLIQNYLISLFIVPTFQANCQITSSILSLNLTQVCVFVFVLAFVLILIIFLSQTEKSFLSIIHITSSKTIGSSLLYIKNSLCNHNVCCLIKQNVQRNIELFKSLFWLCFRS